MRARRTLHPPLWCVVVALVAGCATTTAPSGFLSPPSETQSGVYGGWMAADYAVGKDKREARGELIAVQVDSVFILMEDGLTAIPKATISKAKLSVYDSEAKLLGLWTGVGALSTLSHGAGLILSAPSWIIIGSIATASQSHAPHIVSSTFEEKLWEEIRKYARFPQGLPPGLDPRSLK